jgi:SNF2 family DNA or RNA helicase
VAVVTIAFQAEQARGIFSRSDGEVPDSVWNRLSVSASALDQTTDLSGGLIRTQWRCALEVLRSHSPLQKTLGFRFRADPSAVEHIKRFQQEVDAVRRAAGHAHATLLEEEIGARLQAKSWNTETHWPKEYQFRDIGRLLALANGANFSVPGAGKTTVTFALHLLLEDLVDCMLVVAPRNAFPAWADVVQDCLQESAPEDIRSPITPLVGGAAHIAEQLREGGHRFIISYDQLTRVELLLRELLTKRRVHLILDESHKVKDAGGKRGRTIMRLGHLAVRRDILSGTPMPQSATDLQSQIDFLWPGGGLGSRIGRGETPRQVVEGLFVRTTKSQLDLPPRERTPVPVQISEAHLAFYSVLRHDVFAKASVLRRGGTGVALKKARQSVVRLLQAAANPAVVASFVAESGEDDGRSQLLRSVLQEGPSARILKTVELARSLASERRKSLIWTIFTPTLRTLVRLLADLNPAVIYGATNVGDEDDDSTRQGQIRRFKTDPTCMVMIANPAAAAEGMSLHMQCHDAIYVDRSYNATHFLQSVDRIHRLGLPQDVITRVHVLENVLPFGVGSIDASVARRLKVKIRAMEELLQDRDLHELALDEEESEGAVDESISPEDIEDLVRELEGRSAPAADIV